MATDYIGISYNDIKSNIQAAFKEQGDFVSKEITIPGYGRKCCLFFLGSQISWKVIAEVGLNIEKLSGSERFDAAFCSLLAPTLSKTTLFQDEMVMAIFEGNTVVIAEHLSIAFILRTHAPKKRSFAESTTEKVVRGPKLAYIEDLDDNIGLTRQMVNSKNLKVEEHQIKENESIKTLSLLYIKGVADEGIIADITDRLHKIKTTEIQDSGMIEELIEDAPFSPFPQMQSTERPDRVTAALNDGRLVLFVANSPFALILPTTFDMLLQSPDDYYERWIASSFLRLLRYMSLFITVFLSSLYISFVSFHHGLLPTDVAMTIIATREDIPFPPILEVLIMEVTIELLREAGIRLPTPLGQTIGLVGGVIIGQAAVEANIVSSLMVIIVSITTITSFTVPSYSFGLSFRLLRFGAIIISAILGLVGVMFFFLFVLIHLSKLTSFNQPYLSGKFFFYNQKWKQIFLLLSKKRALKKPKGSGA
ncbi:MAG: Spore germination protein [Shouchella clausii]